MLWLTGWLFQTISDPHRRCQHKRQHQQLQYRHEDVLRNSTLLPVVLQKQHRRHQTCLRLLIVRKSETLTWTSPSTLHSATNSTSARKSFMWSKRSSTNTLSRTQSLDLTCARDLTETIRRTNDAKRTHQRPHDLLSSVSHRMPNKQEHQKIKMLQRDLHPTVAQRHQSTHHDLRSA